MTKYRGKDYDDRKWDVPKTTARRPKMANFSSTDFVIHIPGVTGRTNPKSPSNVIQAEKEATGEPENRALSIRQPWAEQILRGEKKIEYRSRVCKGMIGKRVYLYASARYDEGELSEYHHMGLKRGDLPTGLVVGTMEVWKCTGHPGNYEWHLRNPERLSEPFKPENKPQPVWFTPKEES